jgi:hypothetical protein
MRKLDSIFCVFTTIVCRTCVIVVGTITNHFSKLNYPQELRSLVGLCFELVSFIFSA